MSESDITETFQDLIDEPDKRFKAFFDFYCDVKLNQSFSIDKYLRSGKEMLRMADVYFHEKNYLHAFVLYSRYVILYLEKIKQHPEYAQINKTELSEVMKQLKRSALPKAEKLKAYIKGVFENEAKSHQSLKEAKQKELESKTKEKLNEENAKIAVSIGINDLHEKSHEVNVEKPTAPPAIDYIEASGQLVETINTDGALINTKRVVIPLVDRSTKPFDYSKYSSITSKYNLRNTIIPFNLTDEFLKIAQNNTSRNIETCGIIAGTLKQNVFILSHCIIPKQNGCSDTCSTEKEYEIFETIDSLNLITLGWIHTHPSQTAFLSSVDMHTHFAYQLMIPEAIAIVCAPKFNDVGIFLLTPDCGMKVIGDCRQSGFHKHQDNPALFEECDHVKIDSNLKINLIDLRNK